MLNTLLALTWSLGTDCRGQSYWRKPKIQSTFDIN